MRWPTRSGILGEPLYRKQEPSGYLNLNSEWVNSAALLGRMNFALQLAQNHVAGVKVDLSGFGNDPEAVAKTLTYRDYIATNPLGDRQGSRRAETKKPGARRWIGDRFAGFSATVAERRGTSNDIQTRISERIGGRDFWRGRDPCLVIAIRLRSRAAARSAARFWLRSSSASPSTA